MTKMLELASAFQEAHPLYRGFPATEVLRAYVIYEENRHPDNYADDGWNRKMSDAFDKAFGNTPLVSEMSGWKIHPETLGSSFTEFLCEQAKAECLP